MVVVTALIIGAALKRHIAARLVRAKSAFGRSAKSRVSFVHLKRKVIRTDIVAETCVAQKCGVLLISVLEVVKLVANRFRHAATDAFKLFLHIDGLSLAMQTVDTFGVVDQFFAVLRRSLIMVVDRQTLHGEAQSSIEAILKIYVEMR